MKGLRYQLKSVLHDKFCLMTFLLPVIVAAALGLAGQIDFSSLGGTLSFGVLEEGILSHTAAWLNRYGTVMVYRTPEELADAVKEPSTNLIGVETAGNGIRTMVSGDELEIYLRTADTLPVLYERRNQAAGEGSDFGASRRDGGAWGYVCGSHIDCGYVYGMYV